MAHLRHPVGAHERRGLDGFEARARQPVHELGLDGRRDEALLVLEAVARAHLHQPHAPRRSGPNNLSDGAEILLCCCVCRCC